MNCKVEEHLHILRNCLHNLQLPVHYHMVGEERFKAVKLLEEARQAVEKMYSDCLKCPRQPEGQDDNEG